MRRNTTKWQILHCLDLKHVQNAPLGENFAEKFQSHEGILAPLDDSYTISWEKDFEYEVLEPLQDI